MGKVTKIEITTRQTNTLKARVKRKGKKRFNKQIILKGGKNVKSNSKKTKKTGK